MFAKKAEAPSALIVRGLGYGRRVRLFASRQRACRSYQACVPRARGGVVDQRLRPGKGEKIKDLTFSPAENPNCCPNVWKSSRSGARSAGT
jgi:hypothetical protein